MIRQFLKINLFFSFVFLIITANVFAAATQFMPSQNGAAEVRIIGGYDQKNNQQLKIIADFKIKDGWKIYAPDETGFSQPPSFDFSGSDNLDLRQERIKILWPKSEKEEEKIGDEILIYQIYHNEISIPIELQVLDANEGVAIKLIINYALCKDICIPVSQDFELRISSSEILSSSSHHNSKFPLLSILFIAFLGGLILNIMPCVLPVLSLKLLSIISHSHATMTHIRIAYLSTICGIIFSFLLLATITTILKLLGNSLGWGLQFQNPNFLIFLIIVLMIFISNLLGSFEISFNSFLASLLNKKISQERISHNIFLENFLSGILAVLLATPCSAPFLGTALSFALSQEINEIFLIFIFVSFGLAFPYFILLAFPNMTNLLPKPGKWMENIKQIMAGLLIATIVWLIYILTGNIGFVPAMLVGAIASLILVFLKLSAKYGIKTWHKILIFILIISSLFYFPQIISKNFKYKEIEYNQLWEKFDATRISNLVAQGKVVVIDITADWCLTCKVNKILVLNSDEVMAKLKEPNIVALRGDITKPNPKIMDFLRSHNRYAIPFNAVYGPGAPDGLLASELLSKEKLLEMIELASVSKSKNNE